MNASSGAEVRQHILNIAKPIMLHKGFSAVGLNEILAAAGIPKGSFYHYFGSWLHTQCADDPQGKCLAVKLGAEVSDLSEAMRAVLRQGTSQIIERLAGGIEAGLADGSLSGIADPSHTAAILYEMWLGATLLEKIHRDRKPLERAMVETRRMLNLPPAEHGGARS
ncbi:TPA: TetR/AcrR family transcriptional regulator [Burkholderia cepacia]|nr:TetR family transcriptional regulator [Burkholderia cepacia]